MNSEAPKHTLECPCGNKTETTEISFGGIREIGWVPVVTLVGRSVNLCPSCGHKALELAKELQNIFGPEHIMVPIKGKQ